MTDFASEFAHKTVEYDDQMREALLDTKSVLEVRVEFPVLPVTKRIMLETVRLIREGQPVPPERHGKALQESVEALIDKFEEHYRSYQKKKADEVGVDLPEVRLMTGSEKRHLQMFAQWMILQEQRRYRTGERFKDLEKVFEFTNE